MPTVFDVLTTSTSAQGAQPENGVLGGVVQALNLQQAAAAAWPAPTTLMEGADPHLPTPLKERLPHAQAHAERAMAAAERSSRKAHPRHVVQFAALQRAARSPGNRLLALRDLGDEVVAPVAKVSACRAGCAHCCHIPVAMSELEADAVGAAIGLKPASRPPEHIGARPSWGYDKPCPFLRDSRCSIYAHRPMACRWHYNLDKDDLLCRLLPDMTVPVPLADMRRFQAVYTQLSLGGPLADIRDFFPPHKVTVWASKRGLGRETGEMKK